MTFEITPVSSSGLRPDAYAIPSDADGLPQRHFLSRFAPRVQLATIDLVAAPRANQPSITPSANASQSHHHGKTTAMPATLAEWSQLAAAKFCSLRSASLSGRRGICVMDFGFVRFLPRTQHLKEGVEIAGTNEPTASDM